MQKCRNVEAEKPKKKLKIIIFLFLKLGLTEAGGKKPFVDIKFFNAQKLFGLKGAQTHKPLLRG